MKLSLRVKPRAKVEKVEEKDGGLIVFVKAEAKEGKANKAVTKALAEHFGVTPSRVRLISGARSKTKLFEIL
ncbi:DUF167 domain-containing protein [Patescibacteria group bacterium]|nr:MAG: DUF167 domain-containing protein [Patescibacteria group bacterium]